MKSLFAGNAQETIDKFKALMPELLGLDAELQIDAINQIKQALHEISPFKSEPVDCVIWIRNETVTANDYNPNTVAPPEMKLLECSINKDGYTQPIVTWTVEKGYEVIDGFHRHRVGKESKDVAKRVRGYLPIVVANNERTDRGDRIAATIRHNRARGKHRVEAMSNIVVELKRRNWSDDKISQHLGMEPDEILRLTQVSGLAEMFKDSDFSASWDIDDLIGDDGFNLEDAE